MKSIFFRLNGLPSHVRKPRSLKISAISRSQWLIEKAIDLGDKLGLELADLGDGQRPLEHQGARGAARQTHMGGDLVAS